MKTKGEQKMEPGKFLTETKNPAAGSFRLQRGMIVNFKDTFYKVIAARENGKITMKPVKQKK